MIASQRSRHKASIKNDYRDIKVSDALTNKRMDVITRRLFTSEMGFEALLQVLIADDVITTEKFSTKLDELKNPPPIASAASKPAVTDDPPDAGEESPHREYDSKFFAH